MSTDQKKRVKADDSHQLTSERAVQKASAPKSKQASQKRQKPRRRLFPIWLRLLVVLVLSAAALAAGLMIGYGVVGDGSPMNALKWETWQHIIDLVAKGTED